MTKAIKPVAEEAAPVGVPALSINEVDSSDYWKRESALNHAIQFHKNNGGMMTAPQLIDTVAYTFLTFLETESK